MPIITTEALVLKTYDIGDADRYCIVLTPSHGRLAVCAKGVRKLTSRWGSALQSFQHITVDLAEHSSGLYVRSARCMDAFPELRLFPSRFVCASQGVELLLSLLHDTEPSDEVFALAHDYLELCHRDESALLFESFQLMLLKILGLLPSYHGALKFSPALRAFLDSDLPLVQRITMVLSAEDREALYSLCEQQRTDHLSFPLKSSASFTSRSA